MKTIGKLDVYYHDKKVGTLAMAHNRLVAFQYSQNWLKEGFSISPFSLPLDSEVRLPRHYHFDGLYGIFSDSLPDAWGNLLLSRLLLSRNIRENTLTVLDRLAMIGSSGMGALTYRPSKELSAGPVSSDLDLLSGWCDDILSAKPFPDQDNLDALYRLGGSSGGTRPKVLLHIDGHDWIVKFRTHSDLPEAGQMEYDYAVCASHCGINMAQYRLFPSEICSGYFGCLRFDRGHKGARIHMATAAALLEADYRQPCMDYRDLLKLTTILTGSCEEDVKEMYRRMCFNVFAQNQDDHVRNFTFLYDENLQVWRLSPAYDLTRSNTYFGEQTTSVNGKGKNITFADLIETGTAAGLRKKFCEETAAHIRTIVEEELAVYL